MRDATRKLSNRLHLLALCELRLEFALFRHVERVDVKPLRRTGACFRAGHVESDRPVTRAGQLGVDRIDLRPVGTCRFDCFGEAVPARLTDEVRHGLPLDALLPPDQLKMRLKARSSG